MHELGFRRGRGWQPLISRRKIQHSMELTRYTPSTILRQGWSDDLVIYSPGSSPSFLIMIAVPVVVLFLVALVIRWILADDEDLPLLVLPEEQDAVASPEGVVEDRVDDECDLVVWQPIRALRADQQHYYVPLSALSVDERRQLHGVGHFVCTTQGLALAPGTSYYAAHLPGRHFKDLSRTIGLKVRYDMGMPEFTRANQIVAMRRLQEEMERRMQYMHSLRTTQYWEILPQATEYVFCPTEAEARAVLEVRMNPIRLERIARMEAPVRFRTGERSLWSRLFGSASEDTTLVDPRPRD